MATLFSRLAAYYPCDDTHGRSLSEDIVGDNDGTAGVVSSATGKVRQGMFFLASGEQFRSVPDATGLQELKGICCWVKFTTLAADQTLIAKGSDATDANTSIKLWYDHSDTDLAFTVGDGSSSTTINTDGLTLAVDTWYHIRAYNDGNRMGIAVNGTLYASGTARTPLSETGLLYLGRDFGGNYLDGILDEVALFSTSPTVADGAALYAGGDGTTLPLQDQEPGPSGRAGAGTRFTPPTFAESNDAVAYMAHGKLPVKRFDGAVGDAGVQSPTEKPRLSSSGSGVMTGTVYGYSRFLDSEGRVSSVSPISAPLDRRGSLSGAVTGATNASPIVVTSSSHGVTTGVKVHITGQQGNTAANGSWTVTRISDNTFSLDGSIGNGDWTASEPPSLTSSTLTEGSPGVNEVQSLSFSTTPTAGTFTLSLDGEKTSSLNYNDTAATIQSAIEGLLGVGSGNVDCAGGPINTTAVTVTFKGSLGSKNISPLVTDFTGAAVTVSVTEDIKGRTSDVNEVQTAELLNSPSGGTFTISVNGQVTGNLAYNISNAALKTALDGLSTVDSVSISDGPLPALTTIEFQGTQAGQNVPEMVIDPGSLTGSANTVNVTTITDGSAATTIQDNLTAFYDFSNHNPVAGVEFTDPKICQNLVTKSQQMSNPDAVAQLSTQDLFSGLNGFCGVNTGATVAGNLISNDAVVQVNPGAWTVAFWLYGDDLEAARSFECTILVKGSEYRIYFTPDPTTPTVTIVVDRANGTGTETHSYDLTLGTHQDAWALYAFSIDGTELKISVNGSTWDSVDTGVNLGLAGTDDVGIGYDPSDTSKFMIHHRITNLGFWDESLSNAHLSSLYNGGSGQCYPLFDDDLWANTKHYFTLDEASNRLDTVNGWNEAFNTGVNAATGKNNDGARVEPSEHLIFKDDDTLGIDNGFMHVMNTGTSRARLTVSFWINFTTISATAAQIFNARFQEEDNASWYDIGLVSAAGPAVHLRTQLTGGGWSTGFDLGLSTSTWYHIVLVIGSNNSHCEAWVNGVEKSSWSAASGTGTSTDFHFLDQLAFNENPSSSANDYTIDELAIINEGWDSTKIAEAYASGSGKFYTSNTDNEEQQVSITGTPTEGNFRLTYDSQTTANITYDSTASALETALEALSNIGSGNVSCTGGPLPGTAITCEFVGDLAALNLNEMTADSSLLRYEVVKTTDGSGARDEHQLVSVSATPGTGTFTLTFGGQTTDDLDWNATAAETESRLEALSTVGTGNIEVSEGPINVRDLRVKFTGSLGNQDVSAMTATSSLNQTVPLLRVTTTTQGVESQNERKVISAINVTDGTFTTTYSAVTSAAIDVDATASEVQGALEAVSTIGVGNVEVTGGPITSEPIYIEFKDGLGAQNIGAITLGTGGIQNGGWVSGASQLIYADVEVPSSLNVTRRQTLRTKPGSAAVAYIDIDTNDVKSSELISTKTDDELTSDLAVVMIDSNGVDTNLSRHGVPPDWKRSVAAYQNRMFYGVNYVERSMVTVSGDTATGVATDWPNVFDDRTLYEDSGKALAEFDANNQTAALSESTTVDQEATRATIRQGGDDGQRIYHSALTALESLPESVHPGQTFLVSRNARDGDMTGQFVFDGQFYIAFEAAIYRYTFNTDPASAPDGDGRMSLVIPRGLCSGRTVAFTDDLAFCVDREGAYLFDGDTLESVSGPIKPIFTGRGSIRINWKHQDNFHAAYFTAERTIRLFVTLDGGPYPNHALCWNVDQRFWWVEKYAYPIVSSSTGVLDGKSTVFLGSTGRRVFTMDGTREAVGRSVPGTFRGTATSADALSITDSAASFSSSLVGSTVTIASGTGRGQTRRIVEVSGTKLTVHEEWNARPSTDSVYQVAGVNWSIKTGKLRFEQSNESELRRMEVFWEPLTKPNTLDYQLYLDFNAAAVQNERTQTADDTDGIATEEGSSYNTVDLTVRGHVEQDFGGMRQEGVSGNKFLTVETEGSTNDEQLRLLGIAVSGAE